MTDPELRGRFDRLKAEYLSDMTRRHFEERALYLKEFDRSIDVLGYDLAKKYYDRKIWESEQRYRKAELRFNPYHDPQNGRFTSGSGSGVDKAEKSGIIETGSDTVALEYQRYGRNKNTLVNKSYIDSGEYKRKFDNITDNPDVNKALYDCAKKALKHRSGTEFEDMYFIDSSSGKIITQEVNQTDKEKVVYSDKTESALKLYNEIITLHTHPNSMPPSAADFNSAFKNKYQKGFIACHNGKIFGYTSIGEVNESLYNLYIQEYISNGKSEYDAQISALNEIMKNKFIDFWEVK